MEITLDRVERALECNAIEHINAAVMEDADDLIVDQINAMDGYVPECIPVSKDPFFESMDSIEDPTNAELFRIFEADGDISYDEMVGI